LGGDFDAFEKERDLLRAFSGVSARFLTAFTLVEALLVPTLEERRAFPFEMFACTTDFQKPKKILVKLLLLVLPLGLNANITRMDLRSWMFMTL